MAIARNMVFILRRLRRSRSFLFVTLATLAISMGASTAMFTVVNGFLLSSLPYERADQLALIWSSHSQASAQEAVHELPLSPGVFTDIRRDGRSFEQVAAFLMDSVTVTGADGVRRVNALFVSGDFFPLLGVTAELGRTLGPEDEQSVSLVNISYGYWQSRFGGDPGVIGQTIDYYDRAHEVVGVLPADFHFSESLVAADPGLSKPVDIWAPFDLSDRAHERGFHYLLTVGRLRPGSSLFAAREEMKTYSQAAADEYPDTDENYVIEVVALSEQIFGRLRPVLLTLWAATSFILLIACANLATLLLARAQRRRRDTAIRLALGANRSRIVGESLAETVGLALVGGGLSLGVAFVATRLLIKVSPVNVFQNYPPLIDRWVVVFTLAVSLAVGLLFGALPALRAGWIDAAEGLGDGDVRFTGGSRRTFSLLVVSQIALATTLLIGMGLSLQSFRGLLQADLGVKLENVLTLDISLPRFKYRETALKVDFFHQLLEKTKALPGVESVGMNYALPFSGADPSNRFSIEGRPQVEGDRLSANLGLVNPDYFATLGIPLLRGHGFLASDTHDAPKVAIIDQRMAEQYFAGADPLGQRISIASDDPLTIVGVVGAVKQDAFEEVARPYVYLPCQQRCYMSTSLVIKTNLKDSLSLVPAVRAIVTEIDKDLPIANVSTLERAYRQAIAPQRFSLLLISLFAGLALFLMMVGTYAMMAFLTKQRQREAGIRMALGATPKQVFGLIFRQGLAVSLAGTTIGLGIAIAAGKMMASLVYEIGTVDLLVFSIVPAVVLVAAFVAYFSPARTFSRTDPISSLRAS